MSLQESLDKLKDFDPSDLDPESIGTWPLPVKVIIWVIVFGAVVFGAYKLKLEDLNKNLLRAEMKEAELREEFEKKVNEAANLEAYRRQMAEMEESFKALLGQLPQDTEVPGLLEDITDKGVGSGLTFNTIDLKPEKTAEFYIELPIDIDVTGGYHDFGGFVSGVAGLPRIVTLHDFVIGYAGSGLSLGKGGKGSGKNRKPNAGPNTDDAVSSGGKGELQMIITAKTYRYKKIDEDGDES